MCYECISIPIYSRLLNKASNSTSKVQIALLQRFVKQFGRHRIWVVLLNREFSNKARTSF
uniref:Putative transposable element n=1 Tax=Legionella pneumophila TaxID=446 RepID=A0A0U2IDB0_LEGPN|nr:putative transposable element [Legionella pneumophila]